MAFGGTVITFGGFNLPYAGVAPHPRSILSRLGTSVHFGLEIWFWWHRLVISTTTLTILTQFIINKRADA